MPELLINAPNHVMAIPVVNKNILECTEQYIIQQNNCIGCKPHGLSAQIAYKWPYADPYSRRKKMYGNRNYAVEADRPIPGTIEIFKGRNKSIICMYAQYGMGKPYMYNNKGEDAVPDGSALRLQWFTLCLEQITKQVNVPATFALPWRLGCGLAGGDWKKYKQLIENWSSRNPQFTITFYCYEPSKAEINRI